MKLYAIFEVKLEGIEQKYVNVLKFSTDMMQKIIKIIMNDEESLQQELMKKSRSDGTHTKSLMSMQFSFRADYPLFFEHESHTHMTIKI
jgi:hypothetical protein